MVTAPEPLPDVTASEAALRRFLHDFPALDRTLVEASAVHLAARHRDEPARARALDLAVRTVDLTTLESTDTPGRVRALCVRARRPDPDDRGCPPVAAVCLHSDLVPTAVDALAGSGVRVASVAGAFPSGRAPLDLKVAEVRTAVASGADEIDAVLDRGAFLSGRYLDAHDQVAAIRQAAGDAQLKVILETGELPTYDDVRRASWLAMLAGADTIKTSTGKVAPAATLPAALVMLDAVRDLRERTGRQVGVKVAGGIRTAGLALRYLALVELVIGADWLTPERFRFGASRLLDDLVTHRRRALAGAATW
jgi:deoxyribose-phosphate aldolase